jgi:hypothetical protein
MDLEFLTRRAPKWGIALQKTLFVEGDIVEAGERAKEAEGERVTNRRPGGRRAARTPIHLEGAAPRCSEIALRARSGAT